MREINDRKKKKIICSTYSRTPQFCKRNPVDYDLLVDLIKQHFRIHAIELELTNEFLSKKINKIIVSENEILIEFISLPSLICNPNKFSHIG
jgi:hypothetical protein